MVTDFRLWIARMGYDNARQIAAAAALIGVNGRRTASQIAMGRRDLTDTERLAMSAVRAGLKPWTPEYDGELAQMAKADSPSIAA